MDDKLVTDVCRCEMCRGKDALPNRTGGGMNVREALEKLLLEKYAMINANNLAPIIERALRAAYDKGSYDHGTDTGLSYRNDSPFMDSDHGVTAGVAAMMEEGE